MKKFDSILCVIAILLLPRAATAQDDVSAAGWSGRWLGSLTNHPARAGAPAVDVEREVGPLPTTDSACTTFRTTYREQGTVRGVKDFRLCRGTGASDWYVDEGGGTRLPARWLDGALIAPFKYDTLLLIATTRVTGDVMTEEIVTIDDRPAISGVQPLRPRSVQRLEFRRSPP
jgi:hypothetical protein